MSVTTQNTEAETPSWIFSPKFPQIAKIDLILVSKDQVAFGVRKSLLEVHSSVFSDMFETLDIPSSNDIQVIHLEEQEEFLGYILDVIHGRDITVELIPKLSMDLIIDLMTIADKYDLKSFIVICRYLVQCKLNEKPSWKEAYEYFLAFWNCHDNLGVESTSKFIFDHIEAFGWENLDADKNSRFFDKTAKSSLISGLTLRSCQAAKLVVALLQGYISYSYESTGRSIGIALVSLTTDSWINFVDHSVLELEDVQIKLNKLKGHVSLP